MYFGPLSCFFRTWRAANAVLILMTALSFTASICAQDEPIADPIPVFNQAQDLHEKGDLVGAIKLYEKALKIAPEFPEAEYQRAIALLALGRVADAEAAFRSAVAMRADWTLAQTGLASLLISKGDIPEAEKLLTGILAREPQNAPAIMAMVDLSLRANSPAPVLKDLLTKAELITSKAGATASHWAARGSLELALRMDREAKASFSKALTIDAKHIVSLFKLGEIALLEGDVIRAKEILSTLENGTRLSDPIRQLRAGILASEGKYNEALTEVDAIKEPGALAAGLRKQITANRSTDPVELEKELSGDERNVVILGRLCSLYRRDDPAKALTFCRKAAELEPANPTHAVGFGAALVQAKQFDSAVTVLRRIIEIVPDNATARANLATALFQLKHYQEAKEQFLWLTESQPRSAGPYLFLGIIHDQLTEYLDAAASYQQYLRLADPVLNKTDIEKVNLRMPALQKLIKDGKGKKRP